MESTLNLEIGMLKHHKGFTLIEILVVLFIIGITISFALLAFGDFGGNKRIIASAEHFSSYVKVIQQQAIIETQTIGIFVNKNGYQASRLVDNTWQTINLRHLKGQSFPSNAKIHFGQSVSQQPQVIINANGDVSPFQLKFSSRDNPNVINVIGQSNGTILLQ